MTLVLLTALLEAPPPVVAADRELLEQLMTETAVARVPPQPSWAAYAYDVARALVDLIGTATRPFRGWLGTATPLLTVLAWSLLVALGLALCVLLVRALLGRSRRRGPHRSLPTLTRSGEPVPERSRDGWRAEVESRLAASDVAGALHALWWWLASSLMAGGIDASWTTRELLDRCGRRDLSPIARLLDRMTYGPARPAIQDVRGLLGRIETVLP